MPRSHPRKPLRYLIERQQDDAFRQWRDAPGNPPAADSPVVRATVTPIVPEPAVEPALHAELTRAAQAQIDAVIAARPKPTPWELRARYPSGWMNAPYVRCPKLDAMVKAFKEKRDAER